LGVERANAGDPGDGTAFRLQHDFGDHEPKQVVFHGFEQEISGPGVHNLTNLLIKNYNLHQGKKQKKLNMKQEVKKWWKQAQ